MRLVQNRFAPQSRPLTRREIKIPPISLRKSHERPIKLFGLSNPTLTPRNRIQAEMRRMHGTRTEVTVVTEEVLGRWTRRSAILHRAYIESGSQIIRNSEWSTALPVYVNPIGFSLNQHALVVCSQNKVLAQGAALFDFCHPGLERDRFAFKGRTDISNEVRTHDPNRPAPKISFHRPILRG